MRFLLSSGHCLAGFPLSPNLPAACALFARTPPRPLPGQASALALPPPPRPVPRQPDPNPTDGGGGGGAGPVLWRPHGTLLDPPALPAGAVAGGSSAQPPSVWRGPANARHVAAFAAAPGATAWAARSRLGPSYMHDRRRTGDEGGDDDDDDEELDDEDADEDGWSDTDDSEATEEDDGGEGGWEDTDESEDDESDDENREAE